VPAPYFGEGPQTNDFAPPADAGPERERPFDSGNFDNVREPQEAAPAVNREPEWSAPPPAPEPTYRPEPYEPPRAAEPMDRPERMDRSEQMDRPPLDRPERIDRFEPEEPPRREQHQEAQESANRSVTGSEDGEPTTPPRRSEQPPN
jgi:hypothetical protein